ncbi:hypothetical protein [Ehrlichia muris]|nr:hypothetical protein [Ehrlichia muris]
MNHSNPALYRKNMTLKAKETKYYRKKQNSILQLILKNFVEY